jgi:hypothetical protein
MYREHAPIVTVSGTMTMPNRNWAASGRSTVESVTSAMVAAFAAFCWRTMSSSLKLSTLATCASAPRNAAGWLVWRCTLM